MKKAYPCRNQSQLGIPPQSCTCRTGLSGIISTQPPSFRGRSRPPMRSAEMYHSATSRELSVKGKWRDSAETEQGENRCSLPPSHRTCPVVLLFVPRRHKIWIKTSPKASLAKCLLRMQRTKRRVFQEKIRMKTRRDNLEIKIKPNVAFAKIWSKFHFIPYP